MEVDGATWLDHEAIPQDRRRFKRILDARYRGQNYEVRVDCNGLSSVDDLAEVQERFHAAHIQEYGYAIRHRPVQFVSARLQVVGEVAKAPQKTMEGGVSVAAAITGSRRIYIDRRQGWQQASVYDRGKLPINIDFAGPAVVNEMSATTLILPGQSGKLDAWGNLVVRNPL
jgi:N-methylhydantoinase A